MRCDFFLMSIINQDKTEFITRFYVFFFFWNLIVLIKTSLKVFWKWHLIYSILIFKKGVPLSQLDKYFLKSLKSYLQLCIIFLKNAILKLKNILVEDSASVFKTYLFSLCNMKVSRKSCENPKYDFFSQNIFHPLASEAQFFIMTIRS